MANESFTLEEIYEGLRSHYGSFGVVAKEYGCDRQWVREVLKGRQTDAALLVKAAEVWLRYEQAIVDAKANVSNLVKQARLLKNQSVTA